MNVCTHTHGHACRSPNRPEEGDETPGVEIIGSCGLGTKLESFTSASSAFRHRTISLTSRNFGFYFIFSLMRIIGAGPRVYHVRD